MSLVTLKNKSYRYEKNISGKNKLGFSINGVRRNQGWVGQDSLSRHLIKTPFRGTEAIGYGGKNGKYIRSFVKTSTYNTNDPLIIKRSAMNTKGLLLASVKHPTNVFNDCNGNQCNKIWVKDFEPLNYSQSGYIKNIKINTVCKPCKPEIFDDINTIPCKCLIKSTYPGGKRKYVTNIKKTNTDGAIPMSEYIDIGALQKKNLPTPENKKTFPFVINHTGCDTNFITPEDAIAKRMLPENWMASEPPKVTTTNGNQSSLKMIVQNYSKSSQKSNNDEDLLGLYNNDEDLLGLYDGFHKEDKKNDELFLQNWLLDTDVAYSINPYYKE